MKILVTGATGFLGSHLCRKLVRSRFRVTALRRSTSSNVFLDGLNLEFRTADLADANSLSRALKGHDAVIHAAADLNTRGDPECQYRVNVEGSKTLARLCLESGVKRLVHVSSVAAVGIPPIGTIADELFPFNLEGSELFYHISKKRAEEAVLVWAQSGLDVIIVNPAFMFGPHGRSFRGADTIQKVWRSPVVPYFLGGLCIVHVDDVVDGIIAALHHGITRERYILGGENLTYKELVQKSAAALGLRRWFLPLAPVVTETAAVLMESWAKLRRGPPRISYSDARWSARQIYYSSARAQRALEYRPRPFSAILRAYKEHVGAPISH